MLSTVHPVLDGLLLIDKPQGWTSHDVVARVRRLTGQRRVGHAGTLDPMATGVLPLGIGQGTRLLEYVSAAGKAYRARVRLGASTDTYDAEGTVTATASIERIDATKIEAALQPYAGAIEQRPPPFSAIKHHGRPLYTYARAGLAVEVAPRRVWIEALRLLRYEPPELDLEIVCGSGFYVRSLAHDLGQALGCGGHLTALVRTRVGPFTFADAATMAGLEVAVDSGRLTELIWALDAPLRRLPAVILSDAHVEALVQGKRLYVPLQPERPLPDLCRAYSLSGELVAVLAGEKDATRSILRPAKVFPAGRRGPNLALPAC